MDTPEILIELHLPAASNVAGIQEAFPDCEVLTSRGFSGQEIVSLITQPTTAFFAALSAWLFSKSGQGVKTKVKIGKSEIVLENFTAEDVIGFMENPAFQKALREVKKK